MSIAATVKDGVIRLPQEVQLPDGTEVTVEVRQLKPFAERFASFAGAADSGIGDLAENHDRYLYGASQRTP